MTIQTINNGETLLSVRIKMNDNFSELDTVSEKVANKDATGGYAGLTLFKINFKNAANTFTSFFTNANTAARTYTFQDRNGTIADDTDITGAKARANHTGTQLAATISDFNAAALAAAPAETTTTEGALINGATAKTTPVDADYIGLMDSAASNILKKLSWANVKATLKTYFDTLYATTAQANATHTGDATGATALTLATVNANVGSFTNANITVNAKGLIIAASNGTGWGGASEIRIRIPGEMVADTANYQGVFWRNTTGATITISNVKIGVAIAAAGSGAAAAFNVYKSSGTAADGINTNAVNLFTSAVDLGTANTDDTNVPNTTTVEDGRWVSLRCTSSAGATNKASDCEVVIAYS